MKISQFVPTPNSCSALWPLSFNTAKPRLRPNEPSVKVNWLSPAVVLPPNTHFNIGSFSIYRYHRNRLLTCRLKLTFRSQVIAIPRLDYLTTHSRHPNLNFNSGWDLRRRTDRMMGDFQIVQTKKPFLRFVNCQLYFTFLFKISLLIFSIPIRKFRFKRRF